MISVRYGNKCIKISNRPFLSYSDMHQLLFYRGLNIDDGITDCNGYDIAFFIQDQEYILNPKKIYNLFINDIDMYPDTSHVKYTRYASIPEIYIESDIFNIRSDSLKPRLYCDNKYVYDLGACTYKVCNRINCYKIILDKGIEYWFYIVPRISNMRRIPYLDTSILCICN